MKIKTKITKIGRDPKKNKGYINPGIYKGSTIIFNNFKSYIKDRDGKEEGLYEYFDKDGNPTDTKEYINGEMFDIKFEYSENGQPEEKKYYKNGRNYESFIVF